MAHTMQVVQRNLRFILLFTIFTMVIATVTVLLIPQYYRSSVRIIAANPALTDKSSLFNENIQTLYSYFGSGDDLDRIIGIADMDTTYKELIDQYQLIDHYNLKNNNLPLSRTKAVQKLKKDISFQRTEQGQLRIICWMKDNKLSADIVNSMVSIVQRKLESIWQNNYRTATSKLNASIRAGEAYYQVLSDSIAKAGTAKASLLQKHMENQLDELSQYRKTAASFKLIGATSPAALYVLEPAVPATKAERPDKINSILVAALAGFVFAVLFSLLAARKHQN